MERLWKADDKIHRFKLRSPEEDEYLFTHKFSTLKIWSFSAMVDEAEPYIYYDEKIPENDNNRIMDFYESCLQRHYFYHGQYRKHYLSKNPNFSPAIKSLLNKFPDAKFIYLIRNPLEAVPSHISLKEREWQMLGSPMFKYACKEFILRSSEHWYNYSLEVLGNLPEELDVIDGTRQRLPVEANLLPRMKVPSSIRPWIRVPSSTWILSGLTILVSAIGYLFMRQQGKNKD